MEHVNGTDNSNVEEEKIMQKDLKTIVSHLGNSYYYSEPSYDYKYLRTFLKRSIIYSRF
jgi:hypothetical protein